MQTKAWVNIRIGNTYHGAKEFGAFVSVVTVFLLLQLHSDSANEVIDSIRLFLGAFLRSSLFRNLYNGIFHRFCYEATPVPLLFLLCCSPFRFKNRLIFYMSGSMNLKTFLFIVALINASNCNCCMILRTLQKCDFLTQVV